MESKKSFILHLDSLSILDELDNEQSGKLFKAIRNYQLIITNGCDNEFEVDDLITKIAFAPFKAQFNRDVEKYKKTISQKSDAGKLGNLKRWHPDLYDKVFNNKMELKEAESIAESRKVSQSDNSIANIADNVSDSDSVNDNVNDNVSASVLLKKETKEKPFNFKTSLIELGVDENYANDWMKVRKTKKATNTKTALSGLVSQAKKANMSINNAVKLCAERSWVGFNASWIEGEGGSNNKNRLFG